MTSNKHEILTKYNDVARQLVIDKCRNDYFTFLKYVHYKKDAIWNWHHKTICGILQDFILTDKYPHLMLFMPPQHQKTTMMTEYLPAFAFGHNPDIEAMILMFDTPTAQKYNRKIQRIIQSDKYRQIFPDVRLSEKNVVTSAKHSYEKNSSRFEIVGHNGSLLAAGINTGIAGNPGKLILMDDFVRNASDSHSKVFRDKLQNIYDDEVVARMHNDSKIALTITLRHEDGLPYRLIKRDGLIEEGGKWKVLRFPAIKEDNNNPYDKRKIGEVLFPEMHSLERMQNVRDATPRTFASLYQQRPAPKDGDLIKESYFPRHNEWELSSEIRALTRYAVLDTAYTNKTQNDPSGMLVYSVWNSNIILWHYWYGWLKPSKLCPKIVEICNEHEISICRIEPKASGKDIVDMLQSYSNINVAEFESPTKDKVSRINGIEAKLEAGRVWIINGAWNEHFLTECKSFPNAAHDEAPDCLYMAVKEGLDDSNEFIWAI